MRGSIHGMVQVKQTVLVTAGGWGEDWTLDAVWALGKQGENKLNKNNTNKKKIVIFNVNFINKILYYYVEK